jgi:hypothetical protein
MTEFRQFAWLLREALGFSTMPPILILMAICAICGLSAAYAQRRSLAEWRARPSWLFVVYLVLYLLMILVPVLGGIRVDKRFPNRTEEFWLNVLFVGSITFSGYLIYRMKGLRWVAVCLAGIAEAALLGAFFVAGMAASGSWM